MRTRIVVLLLCCAFLCGNAIGAVGQVDQKIWTGQSTADLADVISFYETTTVEPDLFHTYNELNWGEWGIDTYVSSTYGWITPPETGEYTFFISGDDDCVLYLSSNKNTPTGDYICSVVGYTNYQSFQQQATQKSAPISLVAGQYYQFYTVHREGTGGDHLSIAWEGPGITGRAIISSDYIRNNAEIAAGPEPVNGAENVKSSILSWFEPVMIDAATYNVTLYADPNIEYTGLTATELDLGVIGDGVLDYATEYKWRVDAVEAGGTVHKGIPTTFTTNDGKPFFSTQPATTQVKEGETAIFSPVVESVGEAPITIEWYQAVTDGDDIPLGASDELVIENVMYENKGDFYCIATNDVGSTPSNTITLYVTRGLVHRFSFTEDPNDYIGGVDGIVYAPNANVSFENGQIVFTENNVYSSTSGQLGYVDLPNGMISSLGKQMTIITWFTWDGPDNTSDWQRVFDFGSSNNGEDTSDSGDASNYMFLTPCSGSDTIRFGFTDNLNSEGERTTNYSTYAPIGTEICIAITWDEFSNKTYMYYNGTKVSEADLHVTLKEMIDNNVWLGRAQWPDAGFTGKINEMRIYDEALSDAWIAEHNLQGPDVIPANACVAPPAADANGDCYVNMLDLGILAGEWLDCGWIVCE